MQYTLSLKEALDPVFVMPCWAGVALDAMKNGKEKGIHVISSTRPQNKRSTFFLLLSAISWLLYAFLRLLLHSVLILSQFNNQGPAGLLGQLAG